MVAKREEAIAVAKDACARETGESRNPAYWFGFGNAFGDCIQARGWSVGIDRGRRDALAEIARLRALHPEVDIVTCATSFDGDAVEAAKAAGATDFAARSFVDQRVARRLKPGA